MQNHLTLRQAWAKARIRLEEAGIDTAGLDAQLLLCEAMGISRETLIINSEKTLNEANERHYAELVKRREMREPLAYITGRKEFWGLEFAVDRHTLIPRPETETLIEATLALNFDQQEPIRIVDFGTGSGCLLVTLLHLLPKAEGLAVDISEGALAVAQRNAERHGVTKRFATLVSNWDANMEEAAEGGFDLLVSNPPYVAREDLPTLQPEVRDYEPHTALFASQAEAELDTLFAYRQLAKAAARLLKKGGYAVLEAGAEQADDIAALFTACGLREEARRNDLAGITRALVFKAM